MPPTPLRKSQVKVPTRLVSLIEHPIPLETWIIQAFDGASMKILRGLQPPPIQRVSAPRVGSSLGLGRITRRKERHRPALSLLNVLRRVEGGGSLGIDLAARGHEVRKLFYAGFARGLVKDGYDPEDALQEVFRGLLARNIGTCPFDERKSSFGHYVHIVTRCVLANYIRKERRRRSFESTEGQIGGEGVDRFSVGDVADLGCGVKIEQGSLERLVSEMGSGHGDLEGVLSMLAAGYSKRDVCSAFGLEPKRLDQVLTQVRAHLS